MKILFAASEGLPFVKTGGLADVIGSLPNALNRLGHETAVILPLYRSIILNDYDSLERIGTIPVQSGWIHQPATYYRCRKDGVTYYFVEHQGYFERDSLYGYPDDGERFAFFQKSILELFPFIDWWPDVLHANDWQTGVLSLLCRVQYAYDNRYMDIRHVYTIHNLAFQGNFGADMLGSCLGLPSRYYTDGMMRFDTGISFLKTGILNADLITTVSPTYAREILTPDYGERMEEVLRLREGALYGIVNGIDVKEWNPAEDPQIARRYRKRTWKSGKRANKLVLQKQLGLPEEESVCLIGMVSRLTRQKGIYMAIERFAELMEQPVQLVILGTGEQMAEDILQEKEASYRGRFVYYKGYNEALAHLIYAASDIFLMPSLYEPCGISQMIAMRYGTLPLVRQTGGLADTVMPFNEFTGDGNGFGFIWADSADMMNTVRYALRQYADNPEGWRSLVRQAMDTDVSWEESAKEYEALYRRFER